MNLKQVLQRLKDEEMHLRPVVDADRETVKAVLDAQAQQASASVWRERGIGFGVGILSSILATVLAGAVQMTYKRFRGKTE